jgi:hypothetical protein
MTTTRQAVQELNNSINLLNASILNQSSTIKELKNSFTFKPIEQSINGLIGRMGDLINPIDRFTEAIQKTDEVQAKALAINTNVQKFVEANTKSLEGLRGSFTENVDEFVQAFSEGIRLESRSLNVLRDRMQETGQSTSKLNNITKTLITATQGNQLEISKLADTNMKIARQSMISNEKLIDSLEKNTDKIDMASLVGLGSEQVNELTKVTAALQERGVPEKLQQQVIDLLFSSDQNIVALRQQVGIGADANEKLLSGQLDFTDLIKKVAESTNKTFIAQSGAEKINRTARTLQGVQGSELLQAAVLTNGLLQKDSKSKELLMSKEDLYYDTMKTYVKESKNFAEQQTAQHYGLMSNLPKLLEGIQKTLAYALAIQTIQGIVGGMKDFQRGFGISQAVQTRGAAAGATPEQIAGMRDKAFSLAGLDKSITASLGSTVQRISRGFMSLISPVAGLSRVFSGIGTASKFLFVGIRSLLGPIGLAVTVVMALVDAFKWVASWFGSNEDQQSKSKKSFEDLNEAIKDSTSQINKNSIAIQSNSKSQGISQDYVKKNQMLSFEDLKKAQQAVADAKEASKRASQQVQPPPNSSQTQVGQAPTQVPPTTQTPAPTQVGQTPTQIPPTQTQAPTQVPNQTQSEQLIQEINDTNEGVVSRLSRIGDKFKFENKANNDAGIIKYLADMKILRRTGADEAGKEIFEGLSIPEIQKQLQEEREVTRFSMRTTGKAIATENDFSTGKPLRTDPKWQEKLDSGMTRSQIMDRIIERDNKMNSIESKDAMKRGGPLPLDQKIKSNEFIRQIDPIQRIFDKHNEILDNRARNIIEAEKNNKAQSGSTGVINSPTQTQVPAPTQVGQTPTQIPATQNQTSNQTLTPPKPSNVDPQADINGLKEIARLVDQKVGVTSTLSKDVSGNMAVSQKTTKQVFNPYDLSNFNLEKIPVKQLQEEIFGKGLNIEDIKKQIQEETRVMETLFRQKRKTQNLTTSEREIFQRSMSRQEKIRDLEETAQGLTDKDMPKGFDRLKNAQELDKFRIDVNPVRKVMEDHAKALNEIAIKEKQNTVVQATPQVPAPSTAGVTAKDLQMVSLQGPKEKTFEQLDEATKAIGTASTEQIARTLNDQIGVITKQLEFTVKQFQSFGDTQTLEDIGIGDLFQKLVVASNQAASKDAKIVEQGLLTLNNVQKEVSDKLTELKDAGKLTPRLLEEIQSKGLTVLPKKEQEKEAPKRSVESILLNYLGKAAGAQKPDPKELEAIADLTSKISELGSAIELSKETDRSRYVGRGGRR